jgi:hypothetical protein
MILNFVIFQKSDFGKKSDFITRPKINSPSQKSKKHQKSDLLSEIGFLNLAFWRIIFLEFPNGQDEIELGDISKIRFWGKIGFFNVPQNRIFLY